MPSPCRITLLCTALCAAAAQAGVKLEYETKSGSKTMRLGMQVEGKNGRMEALEGGGGGERNAVVLDGDGKRMLFIHYEERTYDELTQARLEQMKAQMDQAMAMMKQQMAGLSPEERARMEAFMGPHQKMMHAVPREEKYVRVAGSKKIAGYRCDLYRVEVDGAHVADTCLIPWADLKVSRHELRRSLESFREGMSFAGPSVDTSMNAWGTGSGLPAWRKEVKEEGGDVVETTLVSISTAAVPKSAFAPPAGFTRRSLGER